MYIFKMIFFVIFSLLINFQSFAEISTEMDSDEVQGEDTKRDHESTFEDEVENIPVCYTTRNRVLCFKGEKYAGYLFPASTAPGNGSYVLSIALDGKRLCYSSGSLMSKDKLSRFVHCTNNYENIIEENKATLEFSREEVSIIEKSISSVEIGKISSYVYGGPGKAFKTVKKEGDPTKVTEKLFMKGNKLCIIEISDGFVPTSTCVDISTIHKVSGKFKGRAYIPKKYLYKKQLLLKKETSHSGKYAFTEQDKYDYNWVDDKICILRSVKVDEFDVLQMSCADFEVLFSNQDDFPALKKIKIKTYKHKDKTLLYGREMNIRLKEESVEKTKEEKEDVGQNLRLGYVDDTVCIQSYYHLTCKKGSPQKGNFPRFQPITKGIWPYIGEDGKLEDEKFTEVRTGNIKKEQYRKIIGVHALSEFIPNKDNLCILGDHEKIFSKQSYFADVNLYCSTRVSKMIQGVSKKTYYHKKLSGVKIPGKLQFSYGYPRKVSGGLNQKLDEAKCQEGLIYNPESKICDSLKLINPPPIPPEEIDVTEDEDEDKEPEKELKKKDNKISPDLPFLKKLSKNVSKEDIDKLCKSNSGRNSGDYNKYMINEYFVTGFTTLFTDVSLKGLLSRHWLNVRLKGLASTRENIVKVSNEINTEIRKELKEVYEKRIANVQTGKESAQEISFLYQLDQIKALRMHLDRLRNGFQYMDIMRNFEEAQLAGVKEYQDCLWGDCGIYNHNWRYWVKDKNGYGLADPPYSMNDGQLLTKTSRAEFKLKRKSYISGLEKRLVDLIATAIFEYVSLYTPGYEMPQKQSMPLYYGWGGDMFINKYAPGKRELIPLLEQANDNIIDYLSLQLDQTYQQEICVSTIYKVIASKKDLPEGFSLIDQTNIKSIEQRVTDKLKTEFKKEDAKIRGKIKGGEKIISFLKNSYTMENLFSQDGAGAQVNAKYYNKRYSKIALFYNQKMKHGNTSDYNNFTKEHNSFYVNLKRISTETLNLKGVTGEDIDSEEYAKQIAAIGPKHTGGLGSYKTQQLVKGSSNSSTPIISSDIPTEEIESTIKKQFEFPFNMDTLIAAEKSLLPVEKIKTFYKYVSANKATIIPKAFAGNIFENHSLIYKYYAMPNVIEFAVQRDKLFKERTYHGNACKAGNVLSCYKLGSILTQNGAYNKAEGPLQKACLYEIGVGCFELARLYSLQQKMDKATQYINKASTLKFNKWETNYKDTEDFKKLVSKYK